MDVLYGLLLVFVAAVSINQASCRLLSVDVLEQCNQTIYVSTGDRGYVIVKDDGAVKHRCSLTIKSSGDDVISMQFRKINFPSCTQSSVEVLSVQGEEEYDQYPVFQSYPHFCGKSGVVSTIANFEQYYDQEWRIVVSTETSEDVYNSANFAFSAHKSSENAQWPPIQKSGPSAGSTTSTKRTSSRLDATTTTVSPPTNHNTKTTTGANSSSLKPILFFPTLTKAISNKYQGSLIPLSTPNSSIASSTTATTTATASTTVTTVKPQVTAAITNRSASTESATNALTITKAVPTLPPATSTAQTVTEDVSLYHSSTSTIPKIISTKATMHRALTTASLKSVTPTVSALKSSSSTLSQSTMNRCSCHVGLSPDETKEFELTFPAVYIHKPCAQQVPECKLHCQTEAMRENLDLLGSLAKVSETVYRDGKPTKIVTTVHKLMCEAFHKPNMRSIRPILYSQVEGCKDRYTSGSVSDRTITHIYFLRYSKFCAF